MQVRTRIVSAVTLMLGVFSVITRPRAGSGAGDGSGSSVRCSRLRRLPRGQARLDRPHAPRRQERRHGQHVPGLPRGRERAPEGPDEEAGAPRRQRCRRRRRARSASPATSRTASSPSGSRASTRRTTSPAPTATTSTSRRSCSPRRTRRPSRPDRGGHLRDVPPAGAQRDAQALAPSDPRGQGEVLRLPQSARRADARDAQARDGEPAVPLVPCGQARAVRLPPPAGRGELPLLPHAARLLARQAAGLQGAEPVPGLPRDAASTRPASTAPTRPGIFADGTRNSSPSTRFIARGCLNCHNSIHGSNAPSSRGKALIR